MPRMLIVFMSEKGGAPGCIRTYFLVLSFLFFSFSLSLNGIYIHPFIYLYIDEP